MGVRDTLRLLLRHPLNRDRPLAAVWRYVRWQTSSLLAPGPVAFPFVNDTMLLATFGMTAATGNCYAGLYEFEDMAFIAHLLRPGELFVDVGANIGSYTVLAAAVGARCLSFEPIPATFAHLQRNVALNELGDRVTLHNLGVGAAPGTLQFTEGLGAMNRATVPGEAHGIAVEVQPLDELIGDQRPVALKIDVEGFETRVIDGADRLLRQPSLKAVLMERNGNGARYGFDEDALHQRLLGYGFGVWRYHPLRRELVPGGDGDERAYEGNTLYLRNPDEVRARVAAAPPLTVNGRHL